MSKIVVRNGSDVENVTIANIHDNIFYGDIDVSYILDGSMIYIILKNNVYAGTIVENVEENEEYITLISEGNTQIASYT